MTIAPRIVTSTRQIVSAYPSRMPAALEYYLAEEEQ